MKSNYLFFIFFSLLLSSCDFGSSSQNQSVTDDATASTDSNTDKPAASSPADNMNVIPGNSFGPIQQNDTEANVRTYYGKENLSRNNISVGEGEFVPGTVVYADTEKEFTILWKPNWPYTQIDRIRFEEDNTPWKTEKGISVGTTLEDLVRINGKEFTFLGFEWDYAGRVFDWKGGAINDKTGIFLIPENPEAVYPHLLGDKEYSSADTHAKNAGLKVDVVEIVF